ncbi:MAG TPA: hypothetical protein VGL09_12700, partial [Methylomirabilota bacterium]
MSALREGPVAVVAPPRVDVDTGAAPWWARLPRSRPRWHNLIAHAILIAAIAVIAFPLYYAFVISTQTLDDAIRMPPRLLPSTALVENYAQAWTRAGMGRLLVNSAVMALGIAIGKIVISLLSAFAIVYFNFRGKQLVFWMIFVT